MTNIVSERLQHNRETPKGIGGWLIILILGLTLVAPLWQLRIAVHTFETLLSPKPLTHAGVFRLSAVVAIYAGLGVFILFLESCCGVAIVARPGSQRLTSSCLC